MKGLGRYGVRQFGSNPTASSYYAINIIMLKNIKLLEKIKPLSYLHDNADFPEYLKVLAPFFQHNFVTATQEERETFFYNLLYLAQRDLSLAHCVQHNHKGRLAIELGPDSAAKTYLNSKPYNKVVCCYSSHRAIDTMRYDPETNTVSPGVKGWLSNLETADFIAIEVPDWTVPSGFSSAHKNHKPTDVGEDIYTIFFDLRKINCSRTTVGATTSIGMKGAAPGIVTIHEELEVGTDRCYILNKNPRRNATNNPWMDYVRQCWVTVHLGVIMGLFNELKTYPELKDPELRYQVQSLELEISSLKLLWEHGLDSWGGKNNRLHKNEILPVTQHFNAHGTQYAKSKEVLLQVINFVLALGLHEFLNENLPQCTRFRDAITYVTHMASLYRCNKKFSQYNNF